MGQVRGRKQLGKDQFNCMQRGVTGKSDSHFPIAVPPHLSLHHEAHGIAGWVRGQLPPCSAGICVAGSVAETGNQLSNTYLLES